MDSIELNKIVDEEIAKRAARAEKEKQAEEAANKAKKKAEEEKINSQRKIVKNLCKQLNSLEKTEISETFSGDVTATFSDFENCNSLESRSFCLSSPNKKLNKIIQRLLDEVDFCNDDYIMDDLLDICLTSSESKLKIKNLISEMNKIEDQIDKNGGRDYNDPDW